MATNYNASERAKLYTTKSSSYNYNAAERAKVYQSGYKGSIGNNDVLSLYRIAGRNGLQKQADEILAKKGEDANKIFSGGVITDIFDVLNAIDYGVVGVLKGKSFKEGVETRQSFADEDALGQYGLAGTIGGVLLDIAVDPLTYIAPTTIIKKIPGATKGIKAVTKAAESSKVGKFLGEKFVWMFGQDKVFKETIERSIKNIGVTQKGINDLVTNVSKLPNEKLGQLLSRDKTGRFIRKSITKLSGFTDEEIESVQKLYTTLDNLGAEAVDLGLLSQGKFEENVGTYLKNVWDKYEIDSAGKAFGLSKGKVKGIKERVGKTAKELEEYGLKQIDNPAYLLLKSTTDLAQDVENAKLFREIASKFGNDVAQDGFSKIPTTKSYGNLAGKYVPEPIYKYLTEVEKARTESEKLFSKAMGAFKYNKVVLNPATHARNIMSNSLLNYWKLGVNPITNAGDYAEAFSEIAKGSGKWIDEASTVGYGIDNFAANELKNNLLAGKGGIAGKVKTIADKIADMYQREENFAKLTAFIAQRKKGMGIEDAWKAAESATFNYAQVTPFVRRLRQSIWGYPFITFALKATPLAAETALTHPGRISVIGKVKNAIEGLSDNEELTKERANEPSWIRNGFYVKLPMKDSNGRSAYFDLTYIIPFGDLISGQFLEGQVSRETGLEEGVAQALTSKSPLINLITEISKNEDFYGDKIWKDSDSQEKKLGDLFRHITKTIMPPIVSDQLPSGYLTSGTNQGKRREKGLAATKEITGQERNITEELLRQVGMKVQPIESDIQETYMNWEKKKALETLLLEAGIIKEFKKTYESK